MSMSPARSLVCVALASLMVTVWVFRTNARRAGGEDEKEKETESAIKSVSHVSRTKEGDPVILLDRASQERLGLQTSALSASLFRPQLVAYGRLQEDPAHSFELRAPVAGSLQVCSQRGWPAIGEVVKRGTVIGLLQPRFTPADRLNLLDRLNAAQAEADAADAALVVSRAALERTRALNADNQNLSDRALQEAVARVKVDEAKRKAALESVRLIGSSVRSASVSAGGAVPLVIDMAGEITEVMAQPAESVEAGQVIARVKRFDTLVARVQLPAGQMITGSPPSGRLVVLGYESTPLRAEWIASAPAVDPETQGLFVLFRVISPRNDLRPGLAVTAYLTLQGQAQKGVVIPQSAVVRASGRMWVYVKSGDDRFVRKEVPAANPTGDGWFTTAGFSIGEQVVTVGAQMLLSEELKSQIQVGEENPA